MIVAYYHYYDLITATREQVNKLSYCKTDFGVLYNFCSENPIRSVFKKLGSLAGAEEGGPRLSTGIDSKIYRLSNKTISRHALVVWAGTARK